MTAFDAIAVGRRVLGVEAEALKTLSGALGDSFSQAVEALFQAKGRIACTGIGKSGLVARKIASTLASTGSPALFVHPAEASHGDLGMIGPGDVILALSKSGEARELADILAYAKRFDIPLLAMTAAPDSALGRAADIVLTLPDSEEATGEINAPTTSTTLQIALGDALAVALLERRGFTARDFRLFHPGGQARRHAAHGGRPDAPPDGHAPGEAGGAHARDSAADDREAVRLRGRGGRGRPARRHHHRRRPAAEHGRVVPAHRGRGDDAGA